VLNGGSAAPRGTMLQIGVACAGTFLNIEQGTARSTVSRLALMPTNASCPRRTNRCFESTHLLRPDPCSTKTLRSH
jgi:hypothetical protein